MHPFTPAQAPHQPIPGITQVSPSVTGLLMAHLRDGALSTPVHSEGCSLAGLQASPPILHLELATYAQGLYCLCICVFVDSHLPNHTVSSLTAEPMAPTYYAPCHVQPHTLHQLALP